MSEAVFTLVKFLCENYLKGESDLTSLGFLMQCDENRKMYLCDMSIDI
jgi:hypothetical protein